MMRALTTGEAFSTKSISDDDLCAGCQSCDYKPGEMSGCRLHWPGIEDADGYVQECAQFQPG